MVIQQYCHDEYDEHDNQMDISSWASDWDSAQICARGEIQL